MGTFLIIHSVVAADDDVGDDGQCYLSTRFLILTFPIYLVSHGNGENRINLHHIQLDRCTQTHATHRIKKLLYGHEGHRSKMQQSTRYAELYVYNIRTCVCVCDCVSSGGRRVEPHTNTKRTHTHSHPRPDTM